MRGENEMATHDGRIHESDLVVPTLEFLASQANGFATTSNIIQHLDNKFDPNGEDAEILEGRSDTKFSQIVRNLVSHRTQQNSLVQKGYADYDKDRRGLQITDKGRQFVKNTDS